MFFTLLGTTWYFIYFLSQRLSKMHSYWVILKENIKAAKLLVQTDPLVFLNLRAGLQLTLVKISLKLLHISYLYAKFLKDWKGSGYSEYLSKCADSVKNYLTEWYTCFSSIIQ